MKILSAGNKKSKTAKRLLKTFLRKAGRGDHHWRVLHFLQQRTQGCVLGSDQRCGTVCRNGEDRCRRITDSSVAHLVADVKVCRQTKRQHSHATGKRENASPRFGLGG